MLEQISQAGARLGLDLTVPFEQLPKKTQNLLLNGGTGFPGILRLLQRSLRIARAKRYREWLMEYMSPIECAGVPRQAAEADEPGGAGEGRRHRAN